MIIKQLLDEDFVNYKKASMFIGFPTCSWKCEKECGMRVCQNGALATAKEIDIDVDVLVERYVKNGLTQAIVCGGLEPFDSFDDLHDLVKCLRSKIPDEIIIFSGYQKHEIANEINILSEYPNIIIKFGRYVPNQEKHYDEVLGVWLASDNQYAERIS